MRKNLDEAAIVIALHDLVSDNDFNADLEAKAGIDKSVSRLCDLLGIDKKEVWRVRWVEKHVWLMEGLNIDCFFPLEHAEEALAFYDREQANGEQLTLRIALLRTHPDDGDIFEVEQYLTGKLPREALLA